MITRRAFLAAPMFLATTRSNGQEGSAMTPASDLEWRFLADTVMGGVSQGGARMEAGALRLQGTVSTANRGGFIQARTEMPLGLPPDATALRLRVKGNGERYFVHLRTTRTLLPWQYFQQAFETGPDWAEVTLPLAGFVASGKMMPGRIRPEDVRSIGIVAYGRDHVADLSLAALGVV
ncbi:NADH ubiquinone oxidoreductase [Rhodobacterales bacterium LSUCC0031]|nr:NADH ubiquinone oxidoreductase [Rhodobacterales bacterium LSUCC0031]